MSRFNSTPPIRTHNGAVATRRAPKDELYLASVGDFFKTEDPRYDDLVKEVVRTDPDWFKDHVTWLRTEGNLRTISLVLALMGAHHGLPEPRKTIASVLTRADEPGEALAFWHSRYGRSLPAGVKRGIADAATNTYTQYSFLKYDSSNRDYRFVDVLNLTHPKPRDLEQRRLFDYIVHGGDPEGLGMIQARKNLGDPRTASPWALKAAGMTWEAFAGTGEVDWQAIMPQMGYMALLRNLRNFHNAMVDPEPVIRRLITEENRQFPFRFLSAHRSLLDAGAYEYLPAISTALDNSLANVPSLSGKTLILADNSASMYYSPGYNGMTLADTSNLFAVSLAARAECATLVSYGTYAEVINLPRSVNVLHEVDKFRSMGGTDTHRMLEQFTSRQEYDRIILLTDEQYNPHTARFRTDCPMYIWNLGGYAPASYLMSEQQYTFGGLTDHSFRVIPLLEM